MLLLFVLTTLSCSAQESIILEKKKVDWTETKGLYKDYEAGVFMDKFHFLEKVDMYEITYLSDELRIESYAAIPKAEGRHPVIVYNRGE